MSQNGTPALALYAACQVTAAGAFVTSALNVGFSKVAIASSVYTLTLADGYNIDALDSAIVATPTTDKQYVTAAQTSDSSITVKGWKDDGSALDTGFHLLVFRKGSSGL